MLETSRWRHLGQPTRLSQLHLGSLGSSGCHSLRYPQPCTEYIIIDWHKPQLHCINVRCSRSYVCPTDGHVTSGWTNPHIAIQSVSKGEFLNKTPMLWMGARATGITPEWAGYFNYFQFRFVYLKVQYVTVIVPHHFCSCFCHCLLLVRFRRY